MVIPTITRSQAASEYAEPKTILGFMLGFFAIVVSAVVAIEIALLSTGHGALAAVVLGAAFLFAVGMIVWIARTHTKNPAALTIGQSTVRDYLAVQQYTAGDSTVGEYLIGRPELPGAGQPLALPAARRGDVADSPAIETGAGESGAPAAEETTGDVERADEAD